MSRESDLTQLWLKWVESELSRVSKFGFWVESELSQVSKFGIWVESELSHLDCHMSQSRVSPKKWVEHNPGSETSCVISKWPTMPPKGASPWLRASQILLTATNLSFSGFSRSWKTTESGCRPSTRIPSAPCDVTFATPTPSLPLEVTGWLWAARRSQKIAYRPCILHSYSTTVFCLENECNLSVLDSRISDTTTMGTNVM